MATSAKAPKAPLTARCLVVGLLAWGCVNPVRGEQIPESVRLCRSQADESQRLRCYDAAVDGSAPARPAPGPRRGDTPADRRQDPPAQATLEARASPVLPAPPPPAAAAAQSAMFKAKVAALSFRPSGAVNVTLDNGQVWSQYGPGRQVPLKAGDTVTLRPGLLGASLLVGPSGWITKVHLIPTSATGP